MPLNCQSKEKKKNEHINLRKYDFRTLILSRGTEID